MVALRTRCVEQQGRIAELEAEQYALEEAHERAIHEERKKLREVRRKIRCAIWFERTCGCIIEVENLLDELGITEES